jgi:starch-binding outer membrane protein, SusD/RagB family
MIKKSLILVFLLNLVSCNDTLDIVQPGELNDAKLFTSVANMQLFLNEAYDRFTTQNEIVASSLLSDEVAIGNSLTSNDTQRFFVVSTNGSARNVWDNHYRAINYCNRLIEGSAKFAPAASDLAVYNSIIAQARAIRAFSHFQLLVMFSENISDDNALGVMKVDFVPTSYQAIPRSKNGEVFQLIESDLAYVVANLGTPLAGAIGQPVTSANSYKFINQNFINAFKARMYLYRKNYIQAELNADLVIASSGVSLSTCSITAPTFPPNTTIIPPVTGSTTINVDPGAANILQRALWTVDQWGATATQAPPYRRMWVDAIQGEVLFAIQRINNAANFGSVYNTNGSYFTGAPLYDMGRNLFDLYTQPLGGGAQDFRRWCFVDRSATISATPTTATRVNEVIVIDKYPGKTGSHTSNDLKVFRLSEMYFIKAECRVRAGDTPGAASLLTQIRQARSYTVGVVPIPIYANATVAYADILLERRKELCFEGHRYIDLKRLATDAGVTGTDRSTQDGINSSATNPTNINVGDYRFTLPIPQAEINVNSLTQNTGY